MARSPFSGSVKGVGLTVLNLRRLIRPQPETVEKPARYLVAKMKEAASLEDHTLEDLRNMGYPYSRRAPQAIHNPDWLVHRHSGKLVEAIGFLVDKRPSSPLDVLAVVGVDTELCPYAEHVIYGTAKMIGRDFVTGVFEEEMETIQKLMMVNARGRLNKAVSMAEAVVGAIT